VAHAVDVPASKGTPRGEPLRLACVSLGSDVEAVFDERSFDT